MKNISNIGKTAHKLRFIKIDASFYWNILKAPQACFIGQQVAEKALKALAYNKGYRHQKL